MTLNAPPDKVNVYTSKSKDQRIIGGPNDGSETWADVTQVPQSVWVEAKAGSSSVGDVPFTVTADDAGPSPSSGQATQGKTAINFQLAPLSSPNGQTGDVKNKSRDWLIGQMVDLYVDVQAPADWKKGVSYKWTAPGTKLYDYQIAPDATSALAVPLRERHTVAVGSDARKITGTAQGELRYFWTTTVAAAPGPDDDTVTVRVGDLHGQSFEVATKFKLYEPTSEFSVKLGSVGRGLENGQRIFGLLPSKTAGTAYGMEFTGKVELPANFREYGPGQWYVTQIITSLNYQRKVNGGLEKVPLNGIRALDSKLKLGDTDPNSETDTFSTGPQVGMTVDSPHNYLTDEINWTGRDDHFEDYLMFVPPGPDSRPIALRTTEVKWGGAVFKDASGAWQLDPNKPRYPATGTSAVGLPAGKQPEWQRKKVRGDWQPAQGGTP